MYNIGLLKLYFKIKNGTIPLYFHNFLVTENVPVEPQIYNFRHKRRVIIPIPPSEYQKRNTKYQLRQLVLLYISKPGYQLPVSKLSVCLRSAVNV